MTQKPMLGKEENTVFTFGLNFSINIELYSLKYYVFEYFWSKVATGPISEFQDLINCQAFISTVGTIACLSYQPNYAFRGKFE